jgi:hypothetical protein
MSKYSEILEEGSYAHICGLSDKSKNTPILLPKWFWRHFRTVNIHLVQHGFFFNLRQVAKAVMKINHVCLINMAVDQGELARIEHSRPVQDKQLQGTPWKYFN